MKHLKWAFVLFLVLLVFVISSYGHCSVELKIQQTAIKYNISVRLALAIAYVESGLNPRAIGELGEVGIYQLRPEIHTFDIHNVNNQIETAIKYLADIRRICVPKYGNAWFICYNTGPYRAVLVQKPWQFDYYVKVINKMKELEKAGI